jgi:hypothetical protein
MLPHEMTTMRINMQSKLDSWAQQLKGSTATLLNTGKHLADGVLPMTTTIRPLDGNAVKRRKNTIKSASVRHEVLMALHCPPSSGSHATKKHRIIIHDSDSSDGAETLPNVFLPAAIAAGAQNHMAVDEPDVAAGVLASQVEMTQFTSTDPAYELNLWKAKPPRPRYCQYLDMESEHVGDDSSGTTGSDDT